MKIASVTYSLKGGAGISTLKLHKEFLRKGLESRIYFVEGDQNVEKELYRIEKKLEINSWRIGVFPQKNNEIFSTGFANTSIRSILSIYEWADIILLRWTTAILSNSDISLLQSKKKPIVWCLSDMAPFTGGCHYSLGCEQFQTNCGNCQKVDERIKYHPSLTLKHKEKLWKNILVISPSFWMNEKVKKSSVFKNNKTTVIHTGVELDKFFPQSQHLSRMILGVDKRKLTILFGADSVEDPRKGFGLLVDAIKHLIKKYFKAEEIQLVIVGKCTGSKLYPEGVDVKEIGYVENNKKLSQVYSCADVCVLPYVEENLPNMMLESLACGTPVVSFAVGGMLDVINEVNGKLSKPYSFTDLASKIAYILENKLDDRSEIRDWAVKNLGINSQSEKYIELFKKLI